MNQNAFFHAPGFLLLLMTQLLTTGCSDSTGDNQAVEDPGAQVELSAKTGSDATVATPKQSMGLVKSVETAGGYTYIEVDINDEIFWLATTPTQLQVGDRIKWQSYAMMSNFSSKALNRVFDRILFVDRVFNENTVASLSHRGTVEEAMNAAGYSFILVDENGSSIWLAAPETRLEVGQAIEWEGGTLMQNFTSRSLNREFDEITFVSAVRAT